VLNVGAGTGAYEPTDRFVLAVEQNAALRAQRPEGSLPAIIAPAESLPFDDDSVDAAMAVLTIHDWQDPAAGLRELRRVARGPVVVLTLDQAHLAKWQREYLAPLISAERQFLPTPAEMAPVLGRRTRIDALRTPKDCADGFIDAFWARPEALLDPQVRASQSSWSHVDEETQQQILARLKHDIDAGVWEAEHGHLRSHNDYDGALRLLVSNE
jgi:SAM-dependent methyltransferase